MTGRTIEPVRYLLILRARVRIVNANSERYIVAGGRRRTAGKDRGGALGLDAARDRAPTLLDHNPCIAVENMRFD